MSEHSRWRAAARPAIVPAIIGVALALVACTILPGSGTKAGGGLVPLTIVVATVDPPGRPASDDVEHFARSVESLSGGAMSVEVRWEAQEDVINPEDPRAYEIVGNLVRSGTADLALVPDFYWVEHGAARLAALKAPFLVTTDPLVTAIVTSDLADAMLAELKPLDAHGLAMLPETLRHPVAFSGAIRSLSDFDGLTMRAMDSQARQLFRRFGADGVRLDGAQFPVAVSEGRVQGADSAFAQWMTLPQLGTFTGDVTYFPKVNILAAAGDWFDGLAPTDQDILVAAARDTLDYVVATNPSDAESARQFCASGGTIVLAGPEQVAAMVQASEGVTATLRRDAVTRSTIDDILRLADEVGPAPESVEGCTGAQRQLGTTPAPTADATASFPEGSYRMEIQPQAFLDAGLDEATAIEHAGVWTLVFRDGQFLDPGCPGSTYAVHGDRVSIVLGPEGPTCGSAAGSELFSARWDYRDGVLRFLDVRGNPDGPVWQKFHEVLWGSVPWQRID